MQELVHVLDRIELVHVLDRIELVHVLDRIELVHLLDRISFDLCGKFYGKRSNRLPRGIP
jgi:hypothetical protein